METHAGHVALVGRPNVGKSTLLNALVGEKLSIVTPRAQTTRDAVTGILTTPSAQLIFVDTPGLLEPQYALHRSMQETALAVLRDADVALLLLDATRPGEVPEGTALDALRRKRSMLQVVVNKVDEGDTAAIEGLEAWSSAELGVQARRISALTGTGLEELSAALTSALPISPFFYPEDELAVQPVRFFVAELVRETVFEEYAEEVPYATVVRVEEYRENAEPIYIRATIYVERDSQKGIILGKAGAGIRTLGARARAKIESFVGAHVYLDLWVKTLPGWRRKVDTLRYLGYRVPESAVQQGDSKARASRDKHGSRQGERPDSGAGKRGSPSRPPRPHRSDENRGRGRPRKES